jgi:hypothetical protein
MRTYLAAAVFSLALAGSAQAMKVTNLDDVPHTISFEAAGSMRRDVLAPGQTVNFYNAPNGRLSLVDSPNPSSGGKVNADGMLSGYIGNGRDQGIPADAMDEYVIWKGGKMQLQRRMKRYGMY